MQIDLSAAGFLYTFSPGTIYVLKVPPLPRGNLFDDFDFQVLSTDHWDWHFYPEASEYIVEDVTRTLACYYSLLCGRVFSHGVVERMAAVVENGDPVKGVVILQIKDGAVMFTDFMEGE